MGVEKLFNSLEKIKFIQDNGIQTGFKNKIRSDYFYDDFNSTVYNVATGIEKELNYLLYAIILNQEEFGGIPLSKTAFEYCTKWNFNVANPTLAQYKDFFTSELIDKVAHERIKESMIIKATQLNEPDDIKIFVISIDGVPESPKDEEQKKRRYNGCVIGELKKKIHKKCEALGKIYPLRKLYETNKISYDRGKIISWTSFMKSLEELFTSESFLLEMKSVCPNLQKIIVSHQNVYGEGEKKIMEYIIENKLIGRHTIFSPDADAIMLGIIAQNELNNGSTFTILRFNQQSEEYDVINIDVLCSNIFQYVKEKTGIISNNITKQSVTNDVAFIFTLFGNDFVPRVESVDARNDIETILDVYCNVIKKAQRKCLIYKSTNSDKYRINYYNFAEFIKCTAAIEPSMLNETYLANKYRNYAYLKKELKVSKLLPTIEEYVITANELFKTLRQKKSEAPSDSDLSYVNDVAAIYTKNTDAKNTKFMEHFLIFEGTNIKRDETGNIINLNEKFTLQLHKIVNHFNSINKEIRGKQIFQQYDQFDPTSPHHKRNIVENLTHPLMEITDYDIECYMLDRKLGEYEGKLNAVNFDLGAVKIGYDANSNYIIKHFYKHDNIIEYYKTFFGINHEMKECISKDGAKKKVINFDDKQMTSLVEDYIKGLFWVFDTYFNKNNSEQNANYVSTWVYPHHRSPLIYQVKEVLFKFASMGSVAFIEKMNNLYSSVTNGTDYMVPRQSFMNKVEHYLYVTPYNKHIELPEKYKQFVENNRDLFPDLTEIAEKIWTSSDNSELIDCRRISFVNKCNLLCVKFVGFNNFMSRISYLRDEIEVPVGVKYFEKTFELIETNQPTDQLNVNQTINSAVDSPTYSDLDPAIDSSVNLLLDTPASEFKTEERHVFVDSNNKIVYNNIYDNCNKRIKNTNESNNEIASDNETQIITDCIKKFKTLYKVSGKKEYKMYYKSLRKILQK